MLGRLSSDTCSVLISKQSEMLSALTSNNSDNICTEAWTGTSSQPVSDIKPTCEPTVAVTPVPKPAHSGRRHTDQTLYNSDYCENTELLNTYFNKKIAPAAALKT